MKRKNGKMKMNGKKKEHKKRSKRCYVCNAKHTRSSRYCSRFCFEWYKKNFKKRRGK